MKNFYIKNITVSGHATEDDSVVEFKDGLNIISGPSNTGKTMILKCIDYLFGNDAEPFTVAKTGYNMVSMTVVCEGKSITARREIGNKKTKNKVFVESEHPEIESGIYAAGAGKRTVNIALWPKLIGITPGQQIIAKVTTGKRFDLTWRSILHMFLIKSENIIKDRSILLPPNSASDTYPLSALLFLITGNDFSSIDEVASKDIRAARKKAVVDFINGRLQYFAARRTELEEIDVSDTLKIQSLAENITAEISALEKEMNSAISRIKQISIAVGPLYERLAESTVLQSRFAELKTRYIADVKRFAFISEGEANRQGLVRSKKCPVCDHDIKQQITPSYFEATRAELKRTELQLNDLIESEKDVLSRIETLRTQITSLEQEKIKLETVLNTGIKPQLSALRISLAKFQKAIAVQSEIEAIGRYEHNLSDELRKKETEEEAELSFKIKSHFTAEILEGIEERLRDILKACNFVGYASAHFGIEAFDLSLNGEPKSGNGDGFCAVLNTVMALAVMEYLTQNGTYAPSLLIVDSPILALMERANKTEAESIKNGLFTYLLENQENGQIIVIDQKVPELDYEDNAQIIRFTQDETEGRYGFLTGVRHYD